MQLIPPDENLLHEQKAEWQALPLMWYASFTKVLQASHVATEIVIQHLGEREITIQCSDIYDKRTWKKFLISTNQPTDLHQLIGVVEKLTIQYKQWLLTQFTKRYQFITAEADLAWIEQVVTIAVKRFIMENKYEVYVRQQPNAFANPLVALIMTIVMKLHDLQKETPRMMHHIVKEPELLNALLKEYFEKLEHLLREGWPLMHEPLPLLPQGMIQPFDRDAEKKEQQGEEGEGEGKQDE